MPPNDDPYDDDGSDIGGANWPAFDGNIEDYWQSSSDEEDFL